MIETDVKYGIGGVPINEWQPRVVYECPHCHNKRFLTPKRVDISVEPLEQFLCRTCGRTLPARSATIQF